MHCAVRAYGAVCKVREELEHVRKGKWPFTECREMCEPLVMDREAWVYLRGVEVDV